MICVIDHQDSFTYNLVQILLKQKWPVAVIDAAESIEAVEKQIGQITAFLLSPGPGAPENAVLSLEILRRYHQTKPILGVCLGHQIIAHAFGAQVKRADRIMHGKTSHVQHGNGGIYESVPQNFLAMRYHSLLVEENSLPSCLEVTSWTQDSASREIMGVKHKIWRVEGIQFHPESILSEAGETLLINFFRKP